MFRHFYILIAILLVAACSTTPEPTPSPTQTPPPTLTPTRTPPPEPTALPSIQELTRASDPSQQAFLSVVHAADTPIFDVYVERLAIATNLNFGQRTEPSGIVAGDYFLRVVPNGMRPDAGEILFEAPVTFQGQDSLILVFTGTEDALSMSAFPRQRDALDRDQSRITVIQAMPGLPPISITQAGSPLVAPLEFGSMTAPITVAAGPVVLDFQSGATTLTTYSQNLLERNSYALVLAGDIASPTIIELRNNVPGLANIRAVNASASLGAIDVYINGEAIASNLDFTRMSDRISRTAQPSTVEVYEAGADRNAVEPLLTDQLTANNDDYITLLFMGTAEDLRLVPYLEDVSLTQPDEARVTFVNSLPTAPRVRIDTQSRPLTEVGEIGYAQPPRPVDLATGAWRFTWIEVEGNQPVELVELADNVLFEPGRSYLYLLTGRIEEPPVILSDNIGFVEEQVDPELEVIQQPTPETRTRIRYINAIKGGLPLSMALDDQTIVTDLPYGASSEAIAVVPGDHTMDAIFGSTGENVANTAVTLENGNRYTVVTYGFGTDPVEILVIDDTPLELDSNSPHLRLMNLSMAAETNMNLGIAAMALTDTPTNLFTESPQTENFRQSLAFGIETIPNITNVNRRSVSAVALAPLGLHGLYVIDAGLNQIATTIHQVDLQPGTHYDVIVFQNLDSMLVEGFAVPYPTG